MNWLGLTAIFVTGVITSVQATAVSGTCASINYSTRCCYPPGDACEASDGNCNCGADCHEFGDCCEDVHCPSNPRRCADIGITTRCCNDTTNTGLCDVHYRDFQNRYCSCNISCHLRNDCCPDAQSIGCIPKTCSEAGNHPGCCMWSASTSCYVRGGRCYCDRYCTFFNDCCTDVDRAITRNCNALAGQQSMSRVRYNLEQTLRTSTIKRFNEKDRKTHNMQNANGRSAYNRKVLAAGTHRTRGKAREFRPRARTLE